ncbi:MAG: matrixin family metalloprotease, partial [Deltaproteobacteria bacterium]|nr:matrixin family metalloprotease [Deltaproteobacteria bacterium]
MRFASKITIILICVFLGKGAFAFSISLTEYNKVVKWFVNSIGYYLDADGVDDITDGSDIKAVEESFSDWANITCSNFSFTKSGTTTSTDVLPITGKMNGKNELIWVEDSKWKFGQWTLGVTVPLYYYDGKIVESDIAFNGYLQKWSTTGNIYKSDVKSVAIHEIGHMFGLQHVLSGYTQSNPPTMAPYADPYLKSRTLEEDDKKGICFLYPATGTYTCAKNDDCPYIVDVDNSGDEYYSGKMTCSGGKCGGISEVTGTKILGELCGSSTECKEPYFCQTLPSGVSMCSQTCDPAQENCPQGFKCQKYTYNNSGYCVPGSPTPEKKADGEKCGYSYECQSSFCYPNPDSSGTYCRTACKVGGTPCPGNFVCFAFSSSSTGGCLPPELVGDTKKKVGEECSKNSECLTGVCFGDQITLCRSQCNPVQENCPQGYYCKVLYGDEGACLPGEKPVPVLQDDGTLCKTGGECKSGTCFPLVGTAQSYCRTKCSVYESNCPGGFECIAYGDPGAAVCMSAQGWTDDPCVSPDQCTSQICFIEEGAQEGVCIFPCISQWCPEGYHCVTATMFGDIC